MEHSRRIKRRLFINLYLVFAGDQPKVHLIHLTFNQN